MESAVASPLAGAAGRLERLILEAIQSLNRRFCRYAQPELAEDLWRRGLYRKLGNYVLVEFALARGWSWNPGKPYWLTIDPTNFCQLHCPFCPTGSNRGVRDKAQLSLDHFKKFMDRLGPSLICMDMINWGEPLLHKDLPEMIAYAKRFGVRVKIDTNLNELSEGTARRLLLSGLDRMLISIDGMTQESYGKYRIGGSLEKLLAHTRLLVSLKRELKLETPVLEWKFIVFRHNEHERERARALAKEYGLDALSFSAANLPNEPAYLKEWLPRDSQYQLYPMPEGEVAGEAALRIKSLPSFKAFHARRFRLSQIASWTQVLRLLSRSRGWRDLRERWGRISAARRENRALLKQAKRSTPYGKAPGSPICKWPWAGTTVNPDGSVAPCCSVEDQADDFGNLHGGFWRLWNNALYRRSRRHVSRYAHGEAGTLADSDHVCERCTAIGYSNFHFPGVRL